MMAQARRKIDCSHGATDEEIRSHVRARLEILVSTLTADAARIRVGAT